MARKTLATVLAALALGGLAAAAGEYRLPPAEPQRFDTVHAYDVRHYRLALRPAMTSDSLYGRQTITAVSMAAGLDTVMLHCVRLEVDSVKLDGAAAGFRRPADSLLVGVGGLNYGQPFALDVFYRGGNFAANGSNSRGYYWYPKSASTLKTLGYTCSAPQDARKWMPCCDEPWDKADSGCVFEITVPDTFVTASNGTLADTVREGNSLTWVWEEDRAIATYLMAFHASQYSFWSDTALTSSGDTIPLLYYMWAPDSATSRSTFATVPGMVECFSSRFGRYPFGKYAMAAVYPFIFGGMENQDMTTIDRYWIINNDQYGIAHELAHSWFGDLVTCGTWADIWLNEGFASNCEAIYDEYLTGKKPGVYMTTNFSGALSGNALTHPIYDPPMPLIYDFSMEYAKGAWVLHMLRWTLGDSAFFPMMRAYADSFADGNAVTTDLQRFAERSYGSGLQWFFDQWVYRAGYPKYTTVIYQRTHPDSGAARVTVKHTSTTGDLYAMPVAVACSTAAGRRDTVVWIDGALCGPFQIEAGPTILWVKLDPDAWILKTKYDSVPRLRAVTPGPCQLALAWNQFTADPTPPAGYNLYRSLAAGGPYDRINGAIVPDTSYLDTGLTAGVRYYYKVTAACAADTCFETKASNVMNNVPTGVAGGPDVPGTPEGLWLGQASANPTSGRARFQFSLPRAGRTRMAVYTVTGQLVRTLVDAEMPAGRHTASWDGRDGRGRRAAAGAYLAELESAGRRLTRTFVLVR